MKCKLKIYTYDISGHISELQDGFYHVCNLAAVFFLLNFGKSYIMVKMVSVEIDIACLKYAV